MSFNLYALTITADQNLQEMPYPQVLKKWALFLGEDSFLSDLKKKPPLKFSQKRSQGKSVIEKALAKNRSILAEMKERSLKRSQKRVSNSSGNLADKVRDTYQKWGKTHRLQLSNWKKKEKLFLENLPYYKKNLILEPKGIEKVSKKKLEAPFSARKYLKLFAKSKIRKRSLLIKGAMDLPIKDQGRRATCAAFASTYALEILLKQRQSYLRLSAQSFYWLSKPACQKSPCHKKGSWGLKGFDSLNSGHSLPTDQNCPYNKMAVIGNETQTPLPLSCQEGKIRTVEYEQVEGLDDILEALKKGWPVIGGFRLTENFYRHNGLVKLKGAKESSKTHASGHALTIIGAAALPEKLHSTEGKICLLVLNSWGSGWGLGGVGCLSENWARKYRFKIPFIAIKSLTM